MSPRLRFPRGCICKSAPLFVQVGSERCMEEGAGPGWWVGGAVVGTWVGRGF